MVSLPFDYGCISLLDNPWVDLLYPSSYIPMHSARVCYPDYSVSSPVIHSLIGVGISQRIHSVLLHWVVNSHSDPSCPQWLPSIYTFRSSQLQFGDLLLSQHALLLIQNLLMPYHWILHVWSVSPCCSHAISGIPSSSGSLSVGLLISYWLG